MPRWKESYNDEDAYKDEEEEDLETYSDEDDPEKEEWLPETYFEDEGT